MISLIFVCISAAAVQMAAGQIQCYHGVSTEQGSVDNLPVIQNCGSCLYQESLYEGSFHNAFHGCVDKCAPYNLENEIRECCETDLCNVKGGSGGSAPSKVIPTPKKPVYLPPREKPSKGQPTWKKSSRKQPAKKRPSIKQPKVEQSEGGRTIMAPKITTLEEESLDEDEY
ncbi:hypothetical protein P879_05282 [Paragonimus westermani]|uniref:Uncharacterized protein n=1 Tax=Paragonimus westermani TaxID=34504 RepID=A0A8T0DP98_9TREM|nr:hypothetical protein P879_05282 [Paragonimus westermani]